jgi:hypothetical protein
MGPGAAQAVVQVITPAWRFKAASGAIETRRVLFLHPLSPRKSRRALGGGPGRSVWQSVARRMPEELH